MRHLTPSEIKEISVPVPGTLNETQRILVEALKRLGPNGEGWLCGTENPNREVNYVHNGKACAIGVIAEVTGGSFEAAASVWCDEGPLLAAAKLYGCICPIYLNDHAKSFSEVRAMFEKAIALAANLEGAA